MLNNELRTLTDSDEEIINGAIWDAEHSKNGLTLSNVMDWLKVNNDGFISPRNILAVEHYIDAVITNKKQDDTKSMKKYFCVCSAYYDDGRAVANIVDTKEASEKPAQTYHAGRRCDSYFDWFDSEQAAKEFIKEAKG